MYPAVHGFFLKGDKKKRKSMYLTVYGFLNINKVGEEHLQYLLGFLTCLESFLALVQQEGDKNPHVFHILIGQAEEKAVIDVELIGYRFFKLF
mgnify:CR=1 FL=1